MVADVWLFTSVLPDVHLQVRKLQVALGAAGVEAHEWFSLLFGLSCGHLRLASNHLSVLLVPHLWNDESRVSRHSHLDGSGTLVHVSIGRDASCSVCDNLKRQCYVFLLLTLRWLLRHCKLMVVGVGKSEHRISRSTSHHHMLGHRRHGVMLQWYGGVSRDSNA